MSATATTQRRAGLPRDGRFPIRCERHDAASSSVTSDDMLPDMVSSPRHELTTCSGNTPPLCIIVASLVESRRIFHLSRIPYLCRFCKSFLGFFDGDGNLVFEPDDVAVFTALTVSLSLLVLFVPSLVAIPSCPGCRVQLSLLLSALL